jgi:Na+-driven multidrug efflux pump
MVISVVMVWAVQVPLAFVLPNIADLGVQGVRWAIVAGTAAGAFAYLVYFRSGRWKHRNL